MPGTSRVPCRVPSVHCAIPVGFFAFASAYGRFGVEGAFLYLLLCIKYGIGGIYTYQRWALGVSEFSTNFQAPASPRRSPIAIAPFTDDLPAGFPVGVPPVYPPVYRQCTASVPPVYRQFPRQCPYRAPLPAPRWYPYRYRKGTLAGPSHSRPVCREVTFSFSPSVVPPEV